MQGNRRRGAVLVSLAFHDITNSLPVNAKLPSQRLFGHTSKMSFTDVNYITISKLSVRCMSSMTKSLRQWNRSPRIGGHHARLCLRRLPFPCPVSPVGRPRGFWGRAGTHPPPALPPYMPSQRLVRRPRRTEQEANGVREYFGTFVPIRSRLVWRR